jgi:chemotaxis signal transduction protein
LEGGEKQVARKKNNSKHPRDENGKISESAALERALDEFFVNPKEDGSLDNAVDELYMGAVKPDRASHEYLSFRLADERFAVSILFIEEILLTPVITDLPRTEPTILGVLSLRGTIVPVVDLRLLLGLYATDVERSNRVLIVNVSDELVGLFVDEVMNVIRLKDDEIEPPPAVFGRQETEHMLGVGRFSGEMYTLLDLQSVVDLDRFVYKHARGV